ncbi:hypothetical protein [Planobispora longispora]|uniref:Lipoprotein n=1 Tax=Planobispora longispora TaxID=28887 RepID=A0A8J3RK39_9ACTN|nr:hypothetical protein [Planobispora longispora]GIH76120.1 hypothetical protein Plo01_25490 [Planobispora longispora]
MSRTRLAAITAALFVATACGSSAAAPDPEPLPDMSRDCNGDDIITAKERRRDC